jgi:hypothetical protein
MMKNLFALATLACLPFVGCTAPIAGDVSPVAEEQSGVASIAAGAMKIVPDSAQHIYFGTPSDASLDDDDYLAYRWFTANPGAEFKVTVMAGDGVLVPGQHVGFKLQRAVKVGHTWTWSVVASDESDEGSAGVKYTAGGGQGLYLVTATSSPLPALLHLRIGCGGTNCATALQPGDACGGRAVGGPMSCDTGTFCSYTLAQQCGAADEQGVCAVEPTACPRGIRYTPVCGCDGNTYDGACNAAAAGTSEQRVGACDHDVTGAWQYIAGWHYDYTFNPDGTFSSQRQPACAFATPHCEIETQLLGGFYNLYGTNLGLVYTSVARNGETAQFAITGAGAHTHLVGADFGVTLDLQHLR